MTNGAGFRAGDIEVLGFCDGTIRVDGGAMFGVVPKTWWAPRCPPDGDNRVSLALNCFLIRSPEVAILVETGMGSLIGRKYLDHYSFQRKTTIREQLRGLGLEVEDIGIVFNSHLHFDHCGGNTEKAADGRIKPAFPRAKYIVQKGEWLNALSPVERDRTSYFPRLLEPLAEAGVLDLLEGPKEIAPGVEAVPIPGHTEFHQGLFIRSGGRTLAFLGDAVPTSCHVGLSSVMSYDLYPVETFDNKKKMLEAASREDWTIAFGHDPRFFFGRVRNAAGGYESIPVLREG